MIQILRNPVNPLKKIPILDHKTTKRMENQAISYREEITKALSFIPDAYLASLYHIIELIARPFRKQQEEEKEEQQQVTPALLQNYTNYFRESFELIMQEGLHLSATYKFVGEQIVLIQWKETQDKNTDLGEMREDLDLQVLVKENEQEYEQFVENIQTKTQILFAEKNIIFCKSVKIDQWTQEQAQADSRDLFGIFMQYIPQYKTESYGLS